MERKLAFLASFRILGILPSALDAAWFFELLGEWSKRLLTKTCW
jgi:hypothetical protein